MFTFTRSALVAAMVVSLGASAGCRKNQQGSSSPRTDFKDLVLLQVNPPDGTTNVFRDADIILEFTAPVDPASVNGTTVQIRDAGGGTPIGTFLVESERVIFRPLNPPALLANSQYSVFVPSFPSPITLMSVEQTPLMGVAQTVRNPSTFSTGAQIRPDTTCPFVVSVNPPQSVSGDPFIAIPYGAVNVPTNANISIRFNEPIAPNSLGPSPVISTVALGVNFAFRLINTTAVGNPATTGTLVLKDNLRVLEFDPNTTFDASITQANGYLAPNTTYRIELWSDSISAFGITDLAGNFLASDAMCNVPASFTLSGGQWTGSFPFTFTTAATSAVPVNDQVVEDFSTTDTELVDPTAYDVVTDVQSASAIDPAQSVPGVPAASNHGAEWNSDTAGGLVTTLTQSGNATLSPNPGMVSYQPGVGGAGVPGLLWTGAPPPTSRPPFDNNLAVNQLGWRIQFIVLKTEIDGSAGVGAANVNPNTDAINGGLLTRLFLREDNTNGAVGPHTFNNVIVRMSHTDQSAFGNVFDPNPNLPANSITFRANHSLSGTLNQPTTVARITSYTTPAANGIGWFEIPIAPTFVWDGVNHVVVDVECRGGTGTIDLAGITQTAGSNRFFFGDVQNPTSNATGVGGVGGLPNDLMPAVAFVFDTWSSAVPAVRTGLAPNGFSKPLGWPSITERGVYDKNTGAVSSYPTGVATGPGTLNPDYDTVTAPARRAVLFTTPPEDIVVRSGLNISTDAAPAFGNFLLRTFEVLPNAVVNISGNNPCIIRTTHTVKIDGIVNADGRSGQSGTTAGGAGGLGGPGGAVGGTGGNGATAGAGSTGTAGFGYDTYNAGPTNQTNPISGATPPGWGAGGGGTGGQGGASGGGGGYATAGTFAPAVGASPGGDGGVAWGSANIIFLSGGAGGGGGGGGVSTTGAGGGGGGGGGGYLQITSDRNVIIAGNATLTARGGNGGTVQGATPGGGGGGGAGGAIVLQGTRVTFTRLGGQPGANLDTAVDLVGPLLFGAGGVSPAAGNGGNGGSGRIRVDSLLFTGQAPGQATATFNPLPVVRNAASAAWLLLPRRINNIAAPGATAPVYADTVSTRATSLWFDSGNADPNYQSVTVQYSFTAATAAAAGALTLQVETCDTDLLGTPDSTTWLSQAVPLASGSTSFTLGALPGINPVVQPTTGTGRLVRITATVRAGTNGVTPELQRVQINYQY